MAFFVFLFIFLSIGWIANEFWLPYRFHPKSLIANAGILVLSMLAAWGLLKLSWIKVSRAVVDSWKPAVPLAFVLIVLNGTLFLDKRMNPPQGPNVVWLLIDALRADHLSCYGYDRQTSPFIDELAKRGVLFKNAYSQESYTIASVPSYFTSTYPIVHGVLYDNPTLDVLDSSFMTLAEILKQSNYKTAAFFFNPHLQTKLNVGQGFEVYDGDMGNKVTDKRKPIYERHETASVIYNKTERYLKKSRRNDEPVFLYLHFLDVHNPYAPPPPYDKLFLPADLHQYSKILQERPWYLKSEMDLCKAMYDGGIRYTDSYLKRTMEMLAKYNITYENTIFILTADHGEEFFDEHPADTGDQLHGRTLYQEQIRVPLIVSLPKEKASKKIVEEKVQLIDILPTVLDVIGIEWRKYPQWQGRSLLPLLEGNPTGFDIVYSGGNRGRSVLISGDWKLYKYDLVCKQRRSECMKKPSIKSGDSIRRQELYNLRQDPKEKTNLIESEPEIAKKLQNQLTTILKESKTKSDQQSIELDDRTIEELKALGYLD